VQIFVTCVGFVDGNLCSAKLPHFLRCDQNRKKDGEGKTEIAENEKNISSFFAHFRYRLLESCPGRVNCMGAGRVQGRRGLNLALARDKKILRWLLNVDLMHVKMI